MTKETSIFFGSVGVSLICVVELRKTQMGIYPQTASNEGRITETYVAPLVWH